MWFRAEITDRALWTVIRFEGELDLESRAIAIAAIDGALNAGYGRLLLDFTDLTFIDLAGVGAILRMLDKTDRLGGDLVIANPSSLATEVLREVGFRDIVHAPVALTAECAAADSPGPVRSAAPSASCRARPVTGPEVATP